MPINHFSESFFIFFFLDCLSYWNDARRTHGGTLIHDLFCSLNGTTFILVKSRQAIFFSVK